MPDITMLNESKKKEKKKVKKLPNVDQDMDPEVHQELDVEVEVEKPVKQRKKKKEKAEGKVTRDKSMKRTGKKLAKDSASMECDESVFIGLAPVEENANDSAIELSTHESTNGVNGKSGSDEEADLTPDRIDGAFENFPLSKSTIDKLKVKGVEYLFPVQAKTFRQIYDGKDLIVQARTGTGKTLAFALPLVEKLAVSHAKPPKVLVLAPTRELAMQVCGDFESVSSHDLRIACIYGGVPYHPQEKAVRRGLDIVVGTPGRMLDIIDRGWLDLSQLEHVVLDEVDRMLDMGFVDDVESIIRSAYNNETKPQTLLFSATLPVWVDRTAKKYMTNDVERIDLVGQQSIRTALSVTHMAIMCAYSQRPSVISDIVTVYSGAHGRAMVFCEMKKDADALASDDNMKLPRHVLHGDITQSKREYVLSDFKAGKCKVLITTDVAARGLDIPNVDLVIQCTPPRDIDSYIHRSGRTGRANRSGISVLLYQPFETQNLRHVELKSGIQFDRVPPPQQKEIIESIGSDARESLRKVAPEMIESFREQAKSVISDMGAEDALAAALSVISGCERIASRSLLGGLKDHTTWELRSTQDIYSKAYVFSTLTKAIPEFDTSLMRDIRATTDRQAFVFDVPNSMNDLIQNKWSDTHYNTLIQCTGLPSIVEEQARGGRNNGGGSRFGWRGRAGGGRGGGRGNRRGGDRNDGSRQRGGRGPGRGGGGDGRGGGSGRRGMGGVGGENTFRYLKRSNRTPQTQPANKRTKFN